MAEGLFSTFSLAELQAMRNGAVSQLGTNKVLISYQVNGQSFSKNFALPYDVLLRELNHALRLRAPSEYGHNIQRTRVSFR